MSGADKVLKRPHHPRHPHPQAPDASPEAARPIPAEAPPGDAPSPAGPTIPTTAVRMSRYEQIKRESSFKMDPEAVKMANEFSEILFHINRALEKLGEFRKQYPFMIAPNVFGSWEGNLKESNSTMLREFQNMREVKTRIYDRRFVCRLCKSVFFVSLPDGICDECRGQMVPNAYDNLNFKELE